MTRPALHLFPLYFSALKIFAALLTILIFYFLPSLWYRFAKKRSDFKLYVVNFLFGWSMVGWWWCWELAVSKISFNSAPSFKRAFTRSLLSIFIICCGIFITTVIKLNLQPNSIDKTQFSVVKPSWNKYTVKAKPYDDPHEHA
ncbi:superinfection immunity protein [Acidithiobacillus thiooxidans]|uniref:superinfection immunity protein n=1 Tax=Acidithiobacillus thiooxidans TaxID=930 RepID=UPI001592FB9C